MDLDDVAEQLYGLPLEEFTAARNARAKELRAAGNRELATQVSHLEKPSLSAWLVNRLARERSEQLQPLIELGDALREATAHLSGDELRELTRQRHQVVHALVLEARRLAGRRVGDQVADEVRQTLEASLADPEVAEAVLSGRMTSAASYAGFGDPSGLAWQRPARRSARRRREEEATPADVADLTERRRKQAEEQLAQAEEELRAARDAHEEAAQQASETQKRRSAADDDVTRLRREVAEAEREAQKAAEAEHAARQRLERAERSLHRAEQHHASTERRLAELR